MHEDGDIERFPPLFPRRERLLPTAVLIVPRLSDMLDKYDCLRKTAAKRTDEIVVTTMSVAMPWAELSDGPLDLPTSKAPWATQQICPWFTAQPERRVFVINGDGSTLGVPAPVTLAQRPAQPDDGYNENGTHEVTGNRQFRADQIDYEQIRRGAGIKHVYYRNEAEFDAHLDRYFTGEDRRSYLKIESQRTRPQTQAPHPRASSSPA